MTTPFQSLRAAPARHEAAVSAEGGLLGTAASTVPAARAPRGMAFRLGDHRFVAPLSDVTAVVPLPTDPVPVPGATSWLLGVGSLRSGLLPVVDLAAFLGIPQAKHPTLQKRRALLVNQPGGQVALCVDEVLGQYDWVGWDHATPVPDEFVRAGVDIRQQRDPDNGQTWNLVLLSALVQVDAFGKAAQD